MIYHILSTQLCSNSVLITLSMNVSVIVRQGLMPVLLFIVKVCSHVICYVRMHADNVGMI